MARNYLKGLLGDHINLLITAAAWNLKQWLVAIVWFFFPWRKVRVSQIPREEIWPCIDRTVIVWIGIDGYIQIFTAEIRC